MRVSTRHIDVSDIIGNFLVTNTVRSEIATSENILLKHYNVRPCRSQC